jgi:hypothetical protein
MSTSATSPARPAPPSTVQFAAVARVLGRAARAAGFVAPSFRCPPRIAGVQRSLRRFPSGGVAVAVRLRGRPFGAVVGDMIEGVVVANALSPAQADTLRSQLWHAVHADQPVVMLVPSVSKAA